MNIGIAGAGVMGRLLAFALINAGHDISLYDQDDGSGHMSCSMAAAGLLTPIAELEKSDLLIFELGREALNQHWLAIIAQLDDQVYFRSAGSLVVAHPRDSADLNRFIDVIASKFQSQMQPVNLFYQKIKSADVEPDIAKFTEAYYFPEEGHLDNQALMKSLGRYIESSSACWHKKTVVTDVTPAKIHTDHRIAEHDMVFDCRGLGARSVFRHLHGIRGELIWLHAPDVNISRPVRFVHPRYGLYIVPRPENKYIIGASEIHAEDHTAISVKSTLELLSAAYYVHPGFAEARIIKTVTQCRPTLPNYLPSIKYEDGLIAINGLYRHGFLIAPALVDEVIRFLTQGVSALRYPKLWENARDKNTIQ